jgi:methyltransferase (TIGR00027 family)
MALTTVWVVAESVRGPSRTAVLTAVARDLYRQEPAPLVFDDALAMGLAGPEGPPLGQRLRRDLPSSHLLAFSRWVCIRSRFAEDLVEQAAARGVEQYVILGAGLDSFAYRRDDLLDRLRVFEVDHPASQSWKRDRLSQLGIQVSDSLVFAPVDFEHQTLAYGLENAGFDFGRSAVFTWIGVTMYLTLDAITATLASIARCVPGTQVALTYNLPHHALDSFAVAVTSTFAGMANEMGEPFVSLFLPGEIEELLRRQRFGDIVHFEAQEARTVYFAGRADVAIAGAQRLVVATVMAPTGPT